MSSSLDDYASRLGVDALLGGAKLLKFLFDMIVLGRRIFGAFPSCAHERGLAVLP